MRATVTLVFFVASLLASACHAQNLAPGWWSFVGTAAAPSVVLGRVVPSLCQCALGRGANVTGWNQLSIITNASASDLDQAFCAGYIEGYVTAADISASYPAAIYSTIPGSVIPPKLTAWVDDNRAWIAAQIAANSSAYWTQVSLTISQLEGMAAGYAAAPAASPALLPLTLDDLWLLNMGGDLEDLIPALNSTLRQHIANLDSDEMLMWHTLHTHCSSLIRVPPDNSDLFAAHTTWSGYSDMLRYYKLYEFNFSPASGTAATRISFSGYPGAVTSIDDFWQTSAGLTVIETTNGNYNMSLYDSITTESLLSFVRAAITNRMATGGKQWTEIFSQFNSGTYNNQWIIVDYKLFQVGYPVVPDTLWILEQIPTRCTSADMSLVLSYGMWLSHNIPFFPDIYEMSGFAQLAQKFGNFYTYTLGPRGKIFRRDGVNVWTLADMQNIMQYNDWENDVFSDNNPLFAISSRGDLLQTKGSLTATAFGGIDSKITSVDMHAMHQASIKGGPTWDQQPPFQWSAWPDVPHQGMADLVKFDFGTVEWDEWLQ